MSEKYALWIAEERAWFHGSVAEMFAKLREVFEHHTTERPQEAPTAPKAEEASSVASEATSPALTP